MTGANGMLASNLIENLLSKGFVVRGLLRDKGKYKGESAPNLELMEGDFTNYETAKLAVDGCDYIIHAAAVTSQSLLTYDEYKRVNVGATAQLLSIAIECGVTRFVYVSTANTIGFGSPSNPADETMPMMSPYSESMYVRSKYEAESKVLAVADRLDVVITNPTFMIGKYGDPAGSNRIFRMARRVTFCPKGGRNFINVVDAAEGVVGAMLRARSGERYLICSENLLYRRFFETMPNVKCIIIIPNSLLRFVGLIGDLLHIWGIQTDMSTTNMEMLCQNIGYSGDKAKRELGFTTATKNRNFDRSGASYSPLHRDRQ